MNDEYTIVEADMMERIKLYYDHLVHGIEHVEINNELVAYLPTVFIFEFEELFKDYL